MSGVSRLQNVNIVAELHDRTEEKSHSSENLHRLNSFLVGSSEMSTSSLTPLLNGAASNPRERDVKLRPNVLIATFVVCLGTLSFGFVVGYPSPVARQLQTELSLSIEEISWFNVSSSVYAVVIRASSHGKSGP